MCANLFYNQAVMKATGVDVNGQVTDLIHGHHADCVAGQEPDPVILAVVQQHLQENGIIGNGR